MQILTLYNHWIFIHPILVSSLFFLFTLFPLFIKNIIQDMSHKLTSVCVFLFNFFPSFVVIFWKKIKKWEILVVTPVRGVVCVWGEARQGAVNQWEAKGDCHNTNTAQTKQNENENETKPVPRSPYIISLFIPTSSYDMSPNPQAMSRLDTNQLSQPSSNHNSTTHRTFLPLSNHNSTTRCTHSNPSFSIVMYVCMYLSLLFHSFQILFSLYCPVLYVPASLSLTPLSSPMFIFRLWFLIL